MRLEYFSVHVSYDGKISGVVHFIGTTGVTHTLNDIQAGQLSALIDQWKAQILDEAAANLIQARDDMLALEHTPKPTSSGVSSTEDNIPF